MGESLRLGIVGCGEIARYTALLSRLVRQIRLTACCDADAQRAVRFAAKHRIPAALGDYATLLARDDIDAVYLAVPHFLHHGMIRDAVTAGKPVLVEKPITRTFGEGADIARMARTHGIKVGVNYQYRYDGACHTLARAVQSGVLGRIHSARINLPWYRPASYFEASPWHKTIAQAGGGTLLTQGSHFLDIVLWALGGKPVSAAGYTAQPKFAVEVETLAHGIVEMEGGALVQICSSMAGARQGTVTIEVDGERGTATYSNRPLPRVRFRGVKSMRYPVPQRGVHALQRSVAAFARWILEDRTFLVPAHEALPVLGTVEAIYRSAASGRRELVESVATTEFTTLTPPGT